MAGMKMAVPWTNVYGLARTILAISTLINLVFHDVDLLFRPLGLELVAAASDIVFTRMSLFSLLSGERLELARWLSIVILGLVVSGWRPRFTGILHWWVSFSFAASCVVVEGGDQVAAIVTLLLIPVTLTDPRKFHWSTAPTEVIHLWRKVSGLIALSAFMVIRIQVAAIYFVASVSKLAVEEWANGTALYYWFLHPVFGVSDWRRKVFLPLLTDPLLTTLMTWGALGVELVLFLGLVMDRRYRPALLVTGVIFHAGIAVVHGLVTFAFVMIASLVLYLRPADEIFVFPSFAKRNMAGRIQLTCAARLSNMAARSNQDCGGDHEASLYLVQWFGG